MSVYENRVFITSMSLPMSLVPSSITAKAHCRVVDRDATPHPCPCTSSSPCLDPSHPHLSCCILAPEIESKRERERFRGVSMPVSDIERRGSWSVPLDLALALTSTSEIKVDWGHTSALPLGRGQPMRRSQEGHTRALHDVSCRLLDVSCLLLDLPVGDGTVEGERLWGEN